jgi:hypothetical protein
MKLHAFLLQVHAYPQQLEAIIHILAASNHYFFIHIDKKSRAMMQAVEVARLKQREDVVFAPSVRVNHGGFSMVRATLNMLEAAIAFPKKIDYFHLISGQDYPCVPVAALDAFFETGNRSYMYFDSPEEIEKWRKTKYLNRTQYFNYVDLHVPFLSPKMSELLIKGLNKIAKLYKRPPVSDIYAGWQWFSWHRNVVEYVLGFLNDNPKYVSRFKRCIYVDELFFHTFLFQKADELNIEKYNSLRYIDWYPKREASTLPLVLDERDWEAIVESQALFCRKVHPEISKNLINRLLRRIESL